MPATGATMTDDDGAAVPGSREEAAAYVADLTSDLASIARRHGLDTLGYLLDMAHLEAENSRRHINGRR
jgi:hypothetical protein